MNTWLYTFFAAVIIFMGSGTAMADLKIKTKQSVGGQSYENTTYIKGKRERSETMGGVMVNITQCDLRRAIQMNPAAKTFTVDEFGNLDPKQPDAPKAAGAPITKGGRIVTTVNIRDTGERKQMFGYTARRLVITMSTESSPEACNRTKTKMETDGWYIDFAYEFNCGDENFARRYEYRKPGGCQDKHELVTTGGGKRGYPVYEKMTMFDENGKESMSIVSEVVELSKASLDNDLFEVPPDYRQVEDSSQLYASAATTALARRSSDTIGGQQGSSTPLPNTATQTAVTGGSELGPKKAGTIRIGLANVRTGAVGGSLNASELAEAVKNTLTAYLSVPNIEVVTLSAKLPSAADSEAREKDCDLVLHVTVSHKKGGGGFGGKFGKVLGSTIASTGIGHTGSTVGNIAGQVITQAAVSATTVASQVKAKDEVTLEVRAVNGAGQQVMSKQYKEKASADGDDIISRVIEQAAQNVVDVSGK
ncbi:MAG: hypothetical protein KF855_14415 [Acidobacteria bacterium]|nr:hypothetical protein [Acidobacteriota bacterium]